MNREKDVLRAKYNQLIDLLEETDPIKHPGEFVSVLDLLDRLHFSIDRQFDHNYPVPVNTAPAPVTETAEPYVEETPVTVMEPASDPEPAKDTGTSYTKEDVRAALAKARKSGVNVAELLGELGYDNFSAVPAGKYGEIMARLS